MLEASTGAFTVSSKRLTLQQLEAHLWGAANILRGKTAGQDYKNYILSLMFYKRLCDQWECEADDAIAELERQQKRSFTEQQKAVFRKRGEHRFNIPDGSRWGDVKAASTNIGEVLTKAMRAVANANDELRGVFTVDWNQPAPDGSGKPLIPNEVVHALIQHFDEHDLSNKSVPPDILGRAYEYLIKQFADDAGAKAGEFFTPPEVVDTLVRILEPRPGDTVYDPTSGSGGMLVHTADYLREHGQHATSARYFAQEMNWGNAAIGKINSVLHGLEADIKAGASTITDPQFLEDGRVKKFSLVLANFPFSDEFWWLKPEQQTDDKKKKDKLKKEIFGKEGFKDPFGRFGRGTGFQCAARRLRRLCLHPAYPRLAHRRRSRRDCLPAGRAVSWPARSRGGDGRVRRRRQSEDEAPQGRRRASDPQGAARRAADRCGDLAAAQCLLRGGRPCLPTHPAQAAPAGTPRSGAAHLRGAALPGALRPERTAPAGRDADAGSLPRLRRRGEGARLSWRSTVGGSASRSTCAKRMRSVAFKPSTRRTPTRLAALDTEIAAARTKRERAKTKGDKAAAETALAQAGEAARESLSPSWPSGMNGSPKRAAEPKTIARTLPRLATNSSRSTPIRTNC